MLMYGSIDISSTWQCERQAGWGQPFERGTDAKIVELVGNRVLYFRLTPCAGAITARKTQLHCLYRTNLKIQNIHSTQKNQAKRNARDQETKVAKVIVLNFVVVQD